jgi:hypothetical protein
MKKTILKRIIIWSATSFVLLVCLIGGILKSSRFINNTVTDITDEYEESNSYNYADITTFNPDEITDITISWAAGKVVVNSYDGDEIIIKQYSDATNDELNPFIYDCNSDDNTLCIYSSENEFKFSDFIEDGLSSFSSYKSLSSEKTLSVSIPNGAYIDNLTIISASADTSVSNVDPAYVRIESYSGTVSAASLNSSTIIINTMSGTTQISDVISDEFDISTVSADIDFNLTDNTSYKRGININTVSGNAIISFPENCNGFMAETNSLSGNFNSEFNGKQNDDEYVYGESQTRIEFNSVSGNLEIKKITSKQAEKAEKESEQAKNVSQAATQPTTKSKQ